LASQPSSGQKRSGRRGKIGKSGKVGKSGAAAAKQQYKHKRIDSRTERNNAKKGDSPGGKWVAVGRKSLISSHGHSG